MKEMILLFQKMMKKLNPKWLSGNKEIKKMNSRMLMTQRLNLKEIMMITSL